MTPRPANPFASKVENGPTGGWIEYIKTFPGGKDARDKTWTEYIDEFNNRPATVPVSSKGPHGHHIIFKKSSNTGTATEKEAAEGVVALLRRFAERGVPVHLDPQRPSVV